MATTYIEQHYSLSVSEFEGLWEMTFMDPFNRENQVSIYIKAPNTDSFYDQGQLKSWPIAKPGPRLTEVMQRLLYQIESYPYAWELSGQKIVSYGYDFESDFNIGGNLTYIDLTEIAFKEVNEFYGFYSPLEAGIVQEGETVSGKGVMTKLMITLDRAKNVNHLAVDFFTGYPMELLSLMYKEDLLSSSPTYEIPLAEAVQSNDSLYIHFPPVYAKCFILILKQETYTVSNQPYDQDKVMERNLWNHASDKARSLYETLADEYLEDLFVTRSGIELHEEIMSAYKNTSKQSKSVSANAWNPYRENFNEIKGQLDQLQH